ncbi:glycoside hydrolase family 25 protein [Oceaniglobus trochenteri]|uniref:glycoside hydrolase family 25 protein n=1 Tax=Oceaniglobus trochenteri TaxID=2763260 RepID=UPI001D00067E|nr:glycoside hydrolase family 25 protein [Oceaniglobus trochenteri]
MRIFLFLVLGFTLLACGGPRSAPPTAGSGFPAAIRPQFQDADPHPWDGPSPNSHAVHGIDASRWQGNIDWPRARQGGVNFAWLKATEGGDVIDPKFRDYWEGARQAGVVPGAYHFFYFCTPAAVQARWFIANVPRQAGSLPPVLDLEWNHRSPTCRLRPDPAVVRREARIFIDIVTRHYGQRPVIYTTPDFWDRNDIAALGEEVWLRSVAGHPSKVYPGARWSFWQYTSTGLAQGIEGEVDLNAFAGSARAWQGWLAARAVR